MKQIYILLFVELLSISCLINKKKTDNFYHIASVTSDVELNDSIYDLINNYIDKYSQFNTFLLMAYTPKLNQINEDYYSDGFLLGPFYEGIHKKDEIPLFYIKIANKMVFIKSRIEFLMKPSISQNTVIFPEMIHRGVDSLILEPNWIIKNGNELFIHRTIYFSICNNRLHVNNRPDTIFAPRLKEMIQFENIKN